MARPVHRSLAGEKGTYRGSSSLCSAHLGPCYRVCVHQNLACLRCMSLSPNPRKSRFPGSQGPAASSEVLPCSWESFAYPEANKRKLLSKYYFASALAFPMAFCSTFLPKVPGSLTGVLCEGWTLPNSKSLLKVVTSP